MATAKYTQNARLGNAVVPIQRNEVWGEDKRWNTTKAIFAAFGAISFLFGVLLFGAILALAGYWAFNYFQVGPVSRPVKTTAVVVQSPAPVIIRPVVVVSHPVAPPVTVIQQVPLTLWQLDK